MSIQRVGKCGHVLEKAGDVCGRPECADRIRASLRDATLKAGMVRAGEVHNVLTGVLQWDRPTKDGFQFIAPTPPEVPSKSEAGGQFPVGAVVKLRHCNQIGKIRDRQGHLRQVESVDPHSIGWYRCDDLEQLPFVVGDRVLINDPRWFGDKVGKVERIQMHLGKVGFFVRVTGDVCGWFWAEHLRLKEKRS